MICISDGPIYSIEDSRDSGVNGLKKKKKKKMFFSFPLKTRFNEGLLRNEKKKKNTDLFACVFTVNNSGTVCIAAKMSCTV